MMLRPAVLALCASMFACGTAAAPGPVRPSDSVDTGTAPDTGGGRGGRQDVGIGVPDAADAGDEDTGAPHDVGAPDDAGGPDTDASLLMDTSPGVDAGLDVGADAGGPDVIGADTAGPDAIGVDTVGVDTDDGCDMDGDGATSVACGGDDCDDMDPYVGPLVEESCNFIDDNCDGVVNDGIECLVYAHTSSTLYLVDPFAGTRTSLGSVPGLFDFDTDPDGALFGISSSTLYRYDEGGARWDVVGSLGSAISANGFAIDSRGVAYATGGNNVYGVDLLTGTATRIGPMGSGFNSSGDCVVNKDDTLYMTSNHGSGGDTLVRIDGDTGTARAIGNTGFSSIYGLTAAWGTLFGFTGSGDVVAIDPDSGVGRRLHGFSGTSWYGAASSTTR